MTDKELRRLKRIDLLGILIDQKKELDELRRRLADAEKQNARNDVLIQRLLTASHVPAASVNTDAFLADDPPAESDAEISDSALLEELSDVETYVDLETPAEAPEAAETPDAPAEDLSRSIPPRRYIPEPDSDDDEFIPMRLDNAPGKHGNSDTQTNKS